MLHTSRSFDSHPLNRVSSSPYELEIESFFVRSSALAHHRSFAGALVRFSFRFQFFFLARLWSFVQKKELAAGFDLEPFRKNVVHSSPRPRCLSNYYNYFMVNTYLRMRIYLSYIRISNFIHIIFQTIRIYPPLVVGRFQRKRSE